LHSFCANIAGRSEKEENEGIKAPSAVRKIILENVSDDDESLMKFFTLLR
jgi:hypothetical protein